MPSSDGHLAAGFPPESKPPEHVLPGHLHGVLPPTEKEARKTPVLRLDDRKMLDLPRRTLPPTIASPLCIESEGKKGGRVSLPPSTLEFVLVGKSIIYRSIHLFTHTVFECPSKDKNTG